jgi:glucose/sorbosone dehydrogenase
MDRLKVLVFCLAIIGAMASARAQDVTPSAVQLEQVLSGLTSPLYVTSARDGSNRLFIVEQPGRIKVLRPGETSPSVFLNISTKVLFGGERGLLGLAFHPQFQTNRRFFVNYTRAGDGATVIAQYQASQFDPNVADAAETILLVIAQPFANHNGGMIEFGPDHFLYIGMGDGGSGNDPGNRAQNVNELLGKLLRIDVDRQDPTTPYASPPDNPFFGAAAGRDEIYATGLRNPFRFSFDRATGQLYAGDVGQNAIEEIDIITRGSNYGWRVFEGSNCTNIDQGLCGTLVAVRPIAEYGHTNGRCSVTGGYVYRGTARTLPAGTYLYGDFCTGEIFMLVGGTPSLLMDTSLSISSFGEDEAGEIYVVGLAGTIHRIINTSPPAPVRLDSAFVRKRSNGSVLQPITVKENGKKYEVVVHGQGFVAGSRIVVGGREINTQAGVPADQELIARLRRATLSEPGVLTVEVVTPDGSRSSQITLTILDFRF